MSFSRRTFGPVVALLLVAMLVPFAPGAVGYEGHFERPAGGDPEEVETIDGERGFGLQNYDGVYKTFTNVRTNRNGRWVVFHSPASFLVPGDLNGEPDIFLHDLWNDEITLVSEAIDGSPAGGDSSFPDISANGRYVVYHSEATDLVGGDNNGAWDVFWWDRNTGETKMVSASGAGVPGNGDSFTGSVSNNGRWVTFTSWADNLTNDIAEPVARIYIADLWEDTVELLVDQPAAGFGADSYLPHISGNGKFVAFESQAALDPADTNGTWDIYLHSSNDDSLTWVTEDSGLSLGSYQPRLSEGCKWLVFESYSDTLTNGDSNGVVDVFRYNRLTGEMDRVSDSAPSADPTAGARTATISANGERVAFQTDSDGEVAGDTNNTRDTYVRDLSEDTIVWASDPALASGVTTHSSYPSISANGDHVVFESLVASPLQGDWNTYWDPFSVDLSGGGLLSVSRPGGPETFGQAFVSGSPGSTSFTDVDAGSYYDAGVGFLLANGITTGVSATEFGPNQPLTRGQLVTLLHRFNGRPLVSGDTPFIDVPAPAFFADAVAWAHTEGVVNGTGPDRFSPMAPITRAQMAAMLHRTAGSPNTDYIEFSDVAPNHFFAGAISWMADRGITTGVGEGRFDPDATITRAQAATFLERFARLSGWAPTWTGGYTDS